MGEAKRARGAPYTIEKVLAGVIAPGGGVTTEMTDVRVTSKSVTAVHNEVMRGMLAHDAKVPCDGCRECCWHIEVEVRAEDEKPERMARLDLVQREGGKTVLRQKEDGSCVHLGEAGCTVYENRPLVCRSYDCRVNALTGINASFERGHRAPPWFFPCKTHKDRVRQIALRMATHAQMEPDGSVGPQATTVAVLVGWARLEKDVAAFVEKMDRSTPEEQRALLAQLNEFHRRKRA